MKGPVRDFQCPVCTQRLAFDNSVCLRCGTDVGFDLPTRSFAAITDGRTGVDPIRQRCANTLVAACNWLVPVESDGPLCASCRLTRLRPSDGDTDGNVAFARAEAAKRRLIVELAELHLPITDRDTDPFNGLCFELLSSADAPVITGHRDGVITLDLAEGDDAHRELLRLSMAEPYRTLLGHFRHEIGHYYYALLVTDPARQQQFVDLFGDPTTDYQAALDRHYANGAPTDWPQRFVSSYATMHPSEDWAETFAHYLHIRDTIDTAVAFGFAPADAALNQPLAGAAGFDRIIELWLQLSWALNMINRSMGQSDLYPFVLPPPALTKMGLVHDLVTTYSERNAQLSPSVGEIARAT